MGQFAILRARTWKCRPSRKHRGALLQLILSSDLHLSSRNVKSSLQARPFLTSFAGLLQAAKKEFDIMIRKTLMRLGMMGMRLVIYDLSLWCNRAGLVQPQNVSSNSEDSDGSSKSPRARSISPKESPGTRSPLAAMHLHAKFWPMQMHPCVSATHALLFDARSDENDYALPDLSQLLGSTYPAK